MSASFLLGFLKSVKKSFDRVSSSIENAMIIASLNKYGKERYSQELNQYFSELVLTHVGWTSYTGCLDKRSS